MLKFYSFLYIGYIVFWFRWFLQFFWLLFWIGSFSILLLLTDFIHLQGLELSLMPVIKNKPSGTCVAQLVKGPTLDLGSGLTLTVVEFELHTGAPCWVWSLLKLNKQTNKANLKLCFSDVHCTAESPGLWINTDAAQKFNLVLGWEPGICIFLKASR